MKVSPPPKSVSAEVRNCYNRVNAVRARYGLQLLEWNDELAECANIRAIDISESFSHTRPDGSQWYSLNPNLLYGENLAYGYYSSKSVHNAWMGSQDHKDNILSSEFTQIGIALYKTDTSWYWVQEFY